MNYNLQKSKSFINIVCLSLPQRFSKMQSEVFLLLSLCKVTIFNRGIGTACWMKLYLTEGNYLSYIS